MKRRRETQFYANSVGLAKKKKLNNTHQHPLLLKQLSQMLEEREAIKSKVP